MSVDEPSKAIQEVAKTTREALPLVNALGEFVGQLIGGPAKQAAGIIEDRLAYVRFEQAVRLRNRVQQLMEEHGMTDPSRPVPLKVAIPLLYEASLEEDDELQDVWARLLFNAARAESEVEVTRSLVSILSDFGPLEAMLLEKIVNAPEIAKKEGGLVATAKLPGEWIEVPQDLSEQVKFTVDEPTGHVEIALLNLGRLGCVSGGLTWGGKQTVTWVHPTALGRTLISACTIPAAAP